MRLTSSPTISSAICRQAASMRGLPGQLVASPMPEIPSSVRIFRRVQLYLTPSTSQTLQSAIFINANCRRQAYPRRRHPTGSPRCECHSGTRHRRRHCRSFRSRTRRDWDCGDSQSSQTGVSGTGAAHLRSVHAQPHSAGTLVEASSKCRKTPAAAPAATIDPDGPVKPAIVVREDSPEPGCTDSGAHREQWL